MQHLQLRKEVHHGRLVDCHQDRPVDIYVMFLDAVRRAPDSIALVDGEERWSYAVLAARVAACAARLTSLGLAPVTGSPSCYLTGPTIPPCCWLRQGWA